MNHRNVSLGPWSSAFDAANTSPLSRFWKRRLAFLAQAANGESRLSRRAMLVLVVFAVAAIALPTIQRIAAPDALAQEGSDQAAGAPAADPPSTATTPRADPNQAEPAATQPRKPRLIVQYLPRPSAPELRIETALQEMTSVDFDGQPLVDVMDYLQSYHSQGHPSRAIQVQIDRRGLEDVGKAIDLPITGRAKDIRLESALRLLLSQHELTFVVIDDVLKITTRDAAEQTMLVRTYLVGDLADGDFETLAETLVTTIAPTSWEKDTGGPGSLAVVPAARSLVVRQTYENHARILELLQMLREARSVSGQHGAAAVGEAEGPSGGAFGGGVRASSSGKAGGGFF